MRVERAKDGMELTGINELDEGHAAGSFDELLL